MLVNTDTIRVGRLTGRRKARSGRTAPLMRVWLTLLALLAMAVPMMAQEQGGGEANLKLPDLNCDSLESAIKTVRGTARSMGIDVIG